MLKRHKLASFACRQSVEHCKYASKHEEAMSSAGTNGVPDPAKYLTGSMVSQMLNPKQPCCSSGASTEKNHVGVGTRDGIGGGTLKAPSTAAYMQQQNHCETSFRPTSPPNHLDLDGSAKGRAVRMFSGGDGVKTPTSSLRSQQQQQQNRRQQQRDWNGRAGGVGGVGSRHQRVCGENYINVDRFFLVAMPILFLIFNVAYWLYFGGHLLIQEAGPIEKY